MATTIGRALIEIGADGSRFQREVRQETIPALRRLGRNLRRSGASMVVLGAGIARTIPMVSGLSLAVANLSSGVFASLAGLSALAGGLASVGGAALALPGILGGVAAGGGTLALALADVDEQLGHLKPLFEEFQSAVSASVWDRMREPIEDMVTTVLPRFQDQMTVTGEYVGDFMATLADELKSSLTADALSPMFDNLNDSIEIAQDALGPLVDAFMTLGRVGSEYLPRLAEWFVEISEAFDDWVQQAYDSGEIFDWIDDGIEGLKDLGSILVSTVRIFGGLDDAAREAGAGGLSALADVMDDIADKVNSPTFQTGLVNIFEGALDAVGSLADSLDPLGDAIYDLSDDIGYALASAGRSAEKIITGISDAIDQPAFQRGLRDFFDGIEAGIEAVLPAMPELGDMLGAVASAAGTLAEEMGPVFRSTIEVLEPIVEDLADALKALAPVVSDVVVGALEAVGPVIADVVEAISGWVQKNPELALTLGIVASAVTTLAGWFIGLVTSLAPAIGAVKGLATTLGKGGGLRGVIAGVMRVGLKFIPVVGWIATALIAAWQNSESFRDALGDLWDTTMEGIGKVKDALMPLFENLSENILPALGEAFSWLGEVIGEVLAWYINTVLIPSIEFMSTVIAGAIDWLVGLGDTSTTQGKIFNEVWTAIRDFVTDAWENYLLPALKGLWSWLVDVATWWSEVGWPALKEAWAAFRDFVVDAWENWLGPALANIWNGFLTVKNWWVEDAWPALREAWSAFREFIIATWENWLGPTLENLWNAFLNVKNWWVEDAWPALKEAWGAFRDTVVMIWEEHLKPILDNLRDKWSEIKDRLVEDAWPAIRDAWYSFRDTVVTIWEEHLKPTLDNLKEKWVEIKDRLVTIWEEHLKPVFDNLRDKLLEIGEKGKEFWDEHLKPVWDKFKTAVGDFWDEHGDTLTNIALGLAAIGAAPVLLALGAVVLAITAIGTAILIATEVIDTATMLMTGDWEGLRDKFKPVGDKIKEIVDGVGEKFTEVKDTVKDKVREMRNAVRDKFNEIKNTIKDKMREARNAVRDKIEEIVNKVRDFPGEVRDQFADAGTLLLDKGREIMNGLRTGLTNGFNTVITWVSEAPGRIQNFFSDAWNWLVDEGRGIFEGLQSGLDSGWASATSFFLSIPGRVTNFFSGAWDWLVSHGRGVIDGFLAGLRASWPGVTNFITGVGTWIEENKGPISHDRVMLKPAGRAIMDGLVGSMREKFPELRKAVEDVNGTLTTLGDVAPRTVMPQVQAAMGTGITDPLNGVRTRASLDTPRVPARGSVRDGQQTQSTRQEQTVNIEVNLNDAVMDSTDRVEELSQSLARRMGDKSRANGKVDLGGATR